MKNITFIFWVFFLLFFLNGTDEYILSPILKKTIKVSETTDQKESMVCLFISGLTLLMM